MVHPLLRLVATQPHLLVDHVHAYGELIGEEVGKTAAGLKTRALSIAIAVGLLVFGVGFLGVALMLWAAIPSGSMNMPWLLIAVPALPLLAGVGFLVYGERKPEPPFQHLKQQVAADMALIRGAGTP